MFACLCSVEANRFNKILSRLTRRRLKINPRMQNGTKVCHKMFLSHSCVSSQVFLLTLQTEFIMFCGQDFNNTSQSQTLASYRSIHATQLGQRLQLRPSHARCSGYC